MITAKRPRGSEEKRKRSVGSGCSSSPQKAKHNLGGVAVDAAALLPEVDATWQPLQVSATVCSLGLAVRRFSFTSSTKSLFSAFFCAHASKEHQFHDEHVAKAMLCYVLPCFSQGQTSSFLLFCPSHARMDSGNHCSELGSLRKDLAENLARKGRSERRPHSSCRAPAWPDCKGSSPASACSSCGPRSRP